jgi:aminoglycoside 6'-N-acetyltransferase
MNLNLRPLVTGDEAELRRIHATPEVKRWWGVPDEDFPREEPGSVRFTIEVDGAIAGLIQYVEESEPTYRHAGIDLFLDPALHGRGIGADAVRRIARLLIDEHGHHRITIDPATKNTAAIRSYEKVGFKPVGVMRQAERDVDGDGWHDSLLMELLAGELLECADAGRRPPSIHGDYHSALEQGPSVMPDRMNESKRTKS